MNVISCYGRASLFIFPKHTREAGSPPTAVGNVHYRQAPSKWRTIHPGRAARLTGTAVATIPINDPKHWRERAEEARTVADEITDPDSKRKMLRIADDYEKLAGRAEKRLAAKNPK